MAGFWRPETRGYEIETRTCGAIPRRLDRRYFSSCRYEVTGVRPSTEQRELFLRTRGANYWAIVWASKRAVESDRDALGSVVASIRFG